MFDDTEQVWSYTEADWVLAPIKLHDVPADFPWPYGDTHVCAQPYPAPCVYEFGGPPNLRGTRTHRCVNCQIETTESSCFVCWGDI